ncbi:hypothetical protein GH714_007474 [Hevea brasiliensis]|uniref:GDSL esterase/lipase n=1 Tax=Hevea brasiliensis TaxID=3981 RepID=A0A6A6KA28_HEVBR|nr:hypothetical protein GH714_007474 [Hevea brasiliensis]
MGSTTPPEYQLGFSNGKVIADFLAEKVGLPTSPPYLSLLSNNNKRPFLTGVNFASGASGILNSTGYGNPFDKTSGLLASVHKDLLEKLGSSGAQNYLSKSLFAIDTGSNDVLSYSDSSDLREKSTPQQYVGLMIHTLKSQMKRLYIYDARKFLIPGVASVGCAPSRRIENRAGECNEELNALSIKYNEGLKSMLLKLKSKLKDINYSYFDAYSFTQNIIQKPAAYGTTCSVIRNWLKGLIRSQKVLKYANILVSFSGFLRLKLLAVVSGG